MTKTLSICGGDITCTGSWKYPEISVCDMISSCLFALRRNTKQLRDLEDRSQQQQLGRHVTSLLFIVAQQLPPITCPTRHSVDNNNIIFTHASFLPSIIIVDHLYYTRINWINCEYHIGRQGSIIWRSRDGPTWMRDLIEKRIFRFSFWAFIEFCFIWINKESDTWTTPTWWLNLNSANNN